MLDPFSKLRPSPHLLLSRSSSLSYLRCPGSRKRLRYIWRGSTKSRTTNVSSFGRPLALHASAIAIILDSWPLYSSTMEGSRRHERATVFSLSNCPIGAISIDGFQVLTGHDARLLHTRLHTSTAVTVWEADLVCGFVFLAVSIGPLSLIIRHILCSCRLGAVTAASHFSTVPSVDSVALSRPADTYRARRYHL